MTRSWCIVFTAVTLMMNIAMNCTVSAQNKPSKRTANAIDVASLKRARVIGELGHALGEIVTIEGVISDGTVTKMKADVGSNLLRIRTVNGKPLASEIVLYFFPFPGSSITTPSAGSTFKFVGYETGGFDGTPEQVFNYVPRTAATDYRFSTSFVLLRADKNLSEVTRKPRHLRP